MSRLEEIVLQKDTRNIAKLQDYVSLTFLSDAAKEILNRKGTIFIITGFYIVYANASETDGPVGAIAISRALKKLGYKVVFITDKWSFNVMKGLLDSEDELVNFPVTNHSSSESFSKNLLLKYSPSVVLSIERASLVKDGTYRNWKGQDISDYNAKLDYLFDQSQYSIGIGDGGNEIGMGNLSEQIKKIKGLPDNPSSTNVNNLIIASCSNWGGFGLVAALSVLVKQNLLISADEAKKLIIKSVDLGAVEGLTGKSDYAVDGRDLEDDSVCIVQLHDFLNELGYFAS
ncbi:MAG: hypothetical protein CL506_01720 [Actinobacteria bacterium]|nr:hypothetical protein [Actinomycetota bacterium]